MRDSSYGKLPIFIIITRTSFLTLFWDNTGKVGCGYTDLYHFVIGLSITLFLSFVSSPGCDSIHSYRRKISLRGRLPDTSYEITRPRGPNM
ncbi:hypothetical protein BJ875DRAFT_462117, partial [Amylocarpus encephaloides]